MGKPDPPAPPNPYATAAAQTSTNVSTAVANAYLNNVNQVTPQGTLDFSPTGSYSWTDPVSGANYTIPTFTSTQTYSPLGQATLDQQNQAKYNLAALGNTQSSAIQNLLASPLNTSGGPAGGNAALLGNLPPELYQFAWSGGPQQDLYAYGNPGQIQTTYGDQSGVLQDRANVESSLFQRLQPQLDLERSQLQTQLANQGIRYGSQAYTAAMDNYNRQVNDARLAITAQGGQEQQLQETIAKARADFANQAQQQLYQQVLGRGQFATQAQQQGFAQQQSEANFYNNAILQYQQQQEQAFNAAQTQRQQWLQEQYAARNQPLNEISSLISGSQVQSPDWINASGGKIPTTDIAGLINDRFTQEQQNYQTATSQYNTTIGGIFGALAGYLKSDVREKENIHRLGSVFTVTNNGPNDHDPDDVTPLPIYQYSYKDDPASVRHIGPMAQDVERTDPDAVREFDGVKYIDTSRVMGGILRAA